MRTDTADWVVNQNCGGKDRFDPTVAMSLTPDKAGAFSTAVTTIEIPNGDEPLTGVKASLPPGLLAKLDGVPRCSTAAFAGGRCDDATKVGRVEALAGQSAVPGKFTGSIFLTDAPSADAVAGLGIRVPVVVGPVDLGFMNVQAKIVLRGDYGVDVISDVPETLRRIPLDQRQLKLTLDRPGFMTNPSVCTGNTLGSELRSSEGTLRSPSAPIAVSGCEQLAFEPSIAFAVDGPAVAGGGAPLVTTVSLPAPADDRSQAPPAKIAVTLPGVTLSPSAGARGDLEGCSDAQFDRGSFADPACPAGSVVGDVAIDTPSVGRLTGKAYLAAGGGDVTARLMLDAVSDEFGSNARVKLIGQVRVDPASGATTATFDEIPPVPFTRFTLRMRGGDSPVLALPRECGNYEGRAAMTATNGATAAPAAALTVDRGCEEGGRFEPSVALGVSDPQAAAATVLTTVVSVPAGQQELRALRLAMPLGLLGQLTASAQCPLDQARAGACGEDSLVGTIRAKTGVREAPFTVAGQVHMTAGEGSAIAGLMFKLPARVGPIDLGEVVTLARIELVGNGLQMQISTDDVPTHVRGIPLMLSELAITIDRPGVVLNPSHCSPQSALGTFSSAQGATAEAGAPLQAAGCERLAWTPGFAVDLSGTPAELGDKGHPTLTIGITQPARQGNLRAADVTLPDGISTDLKNINARVCPSAEAAVQGACPASAKIGTVAIDTPALHGTVSGDLLIVKVPGAVLPGLAIHVRDRIAFDLVGRVAINGQGRIRTVFDGTPDTPITAMTLLIRGGADGVLQLAGDELCTASGKVTDATLTAHHGAAVALKPALRCGGRTQSAQVGNPSQATSTFSLKKGLNVTLSDPNGIKRIIVRLPKGSVFHKQAAKRVKVTPLGGVKAKVKITNDRRKLRITLTPRKKGERVTRVKLAVPMRAVTVNKKVRRLMQKQKTSKKKRRQQLEKLLIPRVDLTDTAGKTRKADFKLKISGIK